jgi:hypothetical protein
LPLASAIALEYKKTKVKIKEEPSNTILHRLTTGNCFGRYLRPWTTKNYSQRFALL